MLGEVKLKVGRDSASAKVIAVVEDAAADELLAAPVERCWLPCLS